MFIRHPKNKLLQYKTGYVLIGPDAIQFKYNKLSTTDITRNDLLKNIAFQENQITIATTSKIPFNVQETILLNNTAYSIDSIYTEDTYNENNLFNIHTDSTITYLVLKKAGTKDDTRRIY